MSFAWLFSTISFLIIAVCIIGTLTECLKGSCVRKESYKVLAESTIDLPEENAEVSINQSQVLDENKPQDISMHDVTVSEKGWWFFHFSTPFELFAIKVTGMVTI